MYPPLFGLCHCRAVLAMVVIGDDAGRGYGARGASASEGASKS